MNQNEYAANKLLLFYSYSNYNKFDVGKLNVSMESHGFSGFLAHDDIRPSFEWQEEIFNNLKKCDIFIPYLTNEFKDSDWADQEIGIAYCENKIIIPLAVDILPYGFINKYQGLKYNPQLVELKVGDIIKTIFSNTEINKDKLKKNLIYMYGESDSYQSAKDRAKMLTRFSDFSEKDINYIIKKSIANDQIYKSFGARDFIKQLIERYKDNITPNDYDKISKLIEENPL